LPELYGCQVGLPNCWRCSYCLRMPKYYNLRLTTNPSTN
jgi:hypothetical protein